MLMLTLLTDIHIPGVALAALFTALGAFATALILPLAQRTLTRARAGKETKEGGKFEVEATVQLTGAYQEMLTHMQEQLNIMQRKQSVYEEYIRELFDFIEDANNLSAAHYQQLNELRRRYREDLYNATPPL